MNWFRYEMDKGHYKNELVPTSNTEITSIHQIFIRNNVC
jgi:hypothetical protein